MGFRRFVSSGLRHSERRSASDSWGVAGVRRVANSCARSSPANLDAWTRERLADRTRLAQELHDTLLQGFFLVSMQLHDAVDRLPAECQSTREKLGEVLQLMNRVLEQGRCAVQDLRSPEPAASLGEAFARVPNDLGFPAGEGFRVLVHGRERELRGGLREEVYRIGREAIVNACRHSRAKEIEVEVRYRPTELHVVVRDNGCGIDPQELQWGREGHWGLQGMRERAEQIGARLWLRSSVALGTEIELSIPGRVAFKRAESADYSLTWNALAGVGR